MEGKSQNNTKDKVVHSKDTLTIQEELSTQKELPMFLSMGVTVPSEKGVNIFISKSNHYNKSQQFRTINFHKPISKF